MPAFGFPPCAEAPAGTWIPLTPLNPNPTLTNHSFWFDPHPTKYDFHEAYECDPPTEKHEHSEQDYSSCFEQEELSETSSDDSRYGYCSYGYGDDQKGNTVKQGDDKGLNNYHHDDDDEHDAYYYADVPHNYASAFDSAYAPALSTYSSSYAPAHIPNNGISAYSSIPYSPSCPMAAPSFHAYPNAWSGLGTTSPRNPLFPLTWGVQGTTSSAQSPYATLAQNHHTYGSTASLQTPAYAYRATLDSSPVADCSHKPVTNSTELTQPQVHKTSSDNHIEGSRGGSAGALFPTPAAQWDEMTKTMTKAFGSSVIGEDSPSTIKEDNIRDAENASKNPNLSSECELLLVSIYNMSTLLKNKLSTYPDTEGHLDVSMLESTIGLLSRCLLKQSADNSTKLTCKLSPQSQQSIQEPSSKPDVPPCPSAASNKDTTPSAEGALSHEENEQIVEGAFVKSLLHHEHDLGLSTFRHQAEGILDDEHRLEEQQTVPSTKMEGSSHSRSTQVCDQTLSDASEESFDKNEEQGDVSELYTSLNGSTDEILTTCEGKSHLETVVAFDSDAEDWEYVTSPSPGRGCSVFKL